MFEACITQIGLKRWAKKYRSFVGEQNGTGCNLIKSARLQHGPFLWGWAHATFNLVTDVGIVCSWETRFGVLIYKSSRFHSYISNLFFNFISLLRRRSRTFYLKLIKNMKHGSCTKNNVRIPKVIYFMFVKLNLLQMWIDYNNPFSIHQDRIIKRYTY